MNSTSRVVLKKIHALVIFLSILIFLDVLIGERFFVISVKSYLFFAFSYLLMGILIYILATLINKFIFKKVGNEIEYFYQTFLKIAVFIVAFVLTNWKLFGGYDFFAFADTIKKFFSIKVLLTNLILLILIVLFGKSIKYYAIKNRKNFEIGDFLNLSMISFSWLYFINYYIFRWSEVPNGLLMISFCFMLIAIAPFIALIILQILDKLTHIINCSETVRNCILTTFLVFVIILTTFVFTTPFLKYFYVEDSTPNLSNDTKKIQNIIWIVLDTARRDHFSCYGYERETTPNIDSFSRESMLFTNYYCTSPWTLPSHASMFTGLYSSSHGAHHTDDLVCMPLSMNHLTIAEILKNNGYKTAAFSANSMVSRVNNFDQGFDLFYYEKGSLYNFFVGLILRTNNYLRDKVFSNRTFAVNKYKLSSEINRLVFKYLRRNKNEHNFIFINYMEPHSGCYYLPGDFKRMYNFSIDKYKVLDLSKLSKGDLQLDTAQQQIAFDWLDCRMNYVDHNVGKLLAKLKEFGMYYNSLIIIMSDHGDLYGEHNSFGHTRDLYEEIIHVPLIIKYPKSLNRIGKNQSYLQTVDIMPEVVSLLGYDYPKYVQGKPFDEVDHEIVAEVFKNKKTAAIYPERFYRDLRAIITISPTPYKYIKSSKNNNKLFDLQNDPFELNNLMESKSKLAKELDYRLAKWMKNVKPVFKEVKKSKKLEKTLEERLKALGYIK